MTKMIEESKKAYQARDKSQAEMTALQQHANKEKTEFESEFNELCEMIKQQQVQLEQLRLKQFERTNNEDTNEDLSFLFDDDTMNQGSLSAWDSDGDKNASHSLPQEIKEGYQRQLQEVIESSQCKDVNELVTKFLAAEDQNFSLFNYVNDINSEIERLEHNVTDMRNQIEQYRGQGMSSDTQRKKTIRDLEEKISKTDKKTAEYEARYQASTRTINQLKNGIHSIFTRVGASSSNVDELMGNQGVTESNMLQYLGVIEQRTTEILQAYAHSQMGQDEGQMKLPIVELSEGAPKVSVTAPSYDDISSGEDSEGEKDERPLTRQELEKRTLKEFSSKTGMLSISLP